MQEPDHGIGVTIVVPTYCPGDALERVFTSLDTLTLPRELFEVIFVDDGSPDDTALRLADYCAAHDNARLIVIENSGWPSRPRNVALDVARGEYVLFLDHDDSLYPDGLRRAYEFAVEHGSDVVNAKESATNDAWWALDSYSDGNIVDIRAEKGVQRLQEFVPHKLYRRALLDEHHIRFPEGRRFLWEDWYLNVPAYRHGTVVSVFADTPLYLWHVGDTNTTRTFDCARQDYWDRLEDLFTHIDSTLSPAGFADDRLELLAYNMRLRVVQRVARMANRREQPPVQAQQMALTRARAMLERHGTPAVLDRLSNKHLAMAHLIREATIEQVRAFEQAERSVRAGVEVSHAEWVDGRLVLDTTTTWRATDPELARFRHDDGALRLDVGPELSAALPEQLLDLTDELARFRVRTALRDRLQHVTWLVPADGQPAHVLVDEDEVQVVASGRVTIDIDTAASGVPLTDSVWDLRFHTELYGMERSGRVGHGGARLAAIVLARPVVGYTNKWRGLSLDIGQGLRSLAVDAAPAPGQLGPVGAFSTRLTSVSTHGTGRIPARLAVLPDALPEPLEEQTELEQLAAAHRFEAEVVVDEHGAWLRGSGDLVAGDYRLYARLSAGLVRTRFLLTVNPGGGAQLIRAPR